MVYDPEPKSAGEPGSHPEAGQGEGQGGTSSNRPADPGKSARNERRRAQRAAAKSAKAHQASTGRDLDYSLTDRTQAPDA